MGLLTKLPRWANTASAGVTEPLESKKDVGWVASEKPPAQYLNWLLKTIYDACVVVDGLAGTAMTWTVAQAFSAAVTMAQTLAITGKLTANGAQDLKGNLALIDTIAQTILKTAAGGLQVGTGSAGGDFDLVAGNAVVAKLLAATGLFDSQGKRLTNLGAPTANGDAATMAYVDAAVSLVTKSADQSDVGGSFVDIADLAFPVLASADYFFDAYLIGSAINTGALRLQFTGPASPTQFSSSWTDSGAGGGAAGGGQVQNTFGGDALVVAAGYPGARYVARISGIFRNGPNAGTVQLRFKTSVAGQSVSVYKASALRYRKLS